MKSLLLTLALFMLQAQMISGNWYVRKCGNKIGKCRSSCRKGEVPIDPPTGMCSKEKTCCVLSGQELHPAICGGTAKPTRATAVAGVTEGSETAEASVASGTSGASEAATSVAATSVATTSGQQ
nr:PREDICTED: beta-defensin 126 [Equus przewalskii]